MRAKKTLSFHLVPRRRVFPAGFSVDRPRARPWDASTIAFFGLINSRFSRARAITRPPDQSHFSLTSLDRERKRERHTEREKRPPKPAKETTQKERERETTPPPAPPTLLTVKERKGIRVIRERSPTQAMLRVEPCFKKEEKKGRKERLNSSAFSSSFFFWFLFFFFFFGGILWVTKILGKNGSKKASHTKPQKKKEPKKGPSFCVCVDET